jgi:hypothetical protein
LWSCFKTNKSDVIKAEKEFETTVFAPKFTVPEKEPVE